MVLGLRCEWTPSMVYVRIVLLALPVIAVAACSGGAPQVGPAAVRGGCEEAAGQGVALGKASAQFVARTDLTYQAENLKGYMLKDGYHAVRLGSSRVDCQAYPLGFGLTHCVAKAQLCGH